MCYPINIAKTARKNRTGLTSSKKQTDKTGTGDGFFGRKKPTGTVGLAGGSYFDFGGFRSVHAEYPSIAATQTIKKQVAVVADKL